MDFVLDPWSENSEFSSSGYNSEVQDQGPRDFSQAFAVLNQNRLELLLVCILKDLKKSLKSKS